jgi:Predicted membrane protein (DUF2243)
MQSQRDVGPTPRWEELGAPVRTSSPIRISSVFEGWESRSGYPVHAGPAQPVRPFPICPVTGRRVGANGGYGPERSARRSPCSSPIIRPGRRPFRYRPWRLRRRHPSTPSTSWHHMISHQEPVDTVLGLERNTLWDGLFHAFTWVVVLVGLVLFARQGDRAARPMVTRPLWGWILFGWGLFNVVEGLFNHHLLQGSPRQGRRGRAALRGSRLSRLRRRTLDGWLAASAAVRPERFHQALIVPSGSGACCARCSGRRTRRATVG